MGEEPVVWGESEQIEYQESHGTLVPVNAQKRLYEYWEDALKDAADKLSGVTTEPGWHQVKTEVHVRHSSPGWVDGFRVGLSP